MKLSDYKLLELKKLKKRDPESDILKKLNTRYLYTKDSGVEFGNILKLLNENICSFQDIVDKFKRVYDEYGSVCLDRLLLNKNLFKTLIENDKLTNDDLKYLLNRISKYDEWNALFKNSITFSFNIIFLINDGTVSYL